MHLGQRHQGDDGFTVVEVMVAIAIFMLVSTAAVNMLLASVSVAKDNQDRVAAANLARNEIDRLRQLGPTAITIGDTSRTVSVPGDPRSFTLTTSTGWLGTGQQMSACDAVAANQTPGQDYVRIHVEVMGGNLDTPQTSDTLVAPADDTLMSTVGAVIAKVTDNLAHPVSGVAITGTNTVSSFGAAYTDADGCVMIPNLSPSPAAWTVTAARSGYVPPTAAGANQNVTLTAGGVQTANFQLAASATLAMSSGNATYLIPGGIPFTYGQDALSTLVVTPATYPYSLSGLWPANGGYLAWLGKCLDANPAYGTSPRLTSLANAPITTPAGATVPVSLPGVQVRVRGLNANTTVSITHAAEATGNCTSSVTYPVGKTDSVGVLRVTLPYGRWSFAASGTPSILATLDPSVPLTTINFPVASLDVVCPTASPTPTPTGTATASPTPTPTVSPSPCVTPSP